MELKQIVPEYHSCNPLRTYVQKLKDLITFPLRAICLFTVDKMGLSSLKSERFDYVAREVSGLCLDMGCGRRNTFVTKYLGGRGVGLDVFPYEGLVDSNVVPDPTQLSYQNNSFDTVTLIAVIHHIPKPIREKELSELWRVLKGKIIITTPNPLAGFLVHRLVHLYHKLFKWSIDEDTDRHPTEEEGDFVGDREIRRLLRSVGFKEPKKKYFGTQWGLNHMWIARK